MGPAPHQEALSRWLLATASPPVSREELVATLWARTRRQGVLEDTIVRLGRSRDPRVKAIASEVLDEVKRRRIRPGFGL